MMKNLYSNCHICRSFNDCNHQYEIVNYNCFISDDKINKPQLTEDQASDIIKIVVNSDGYTKTIKELKQAGYIKRNPVEEAEDLYTSYWYLRRDNRVEYFEVIFKQHDAIQYLKQQLEDKK